MPFFTLKKWLQAIFSHFSVKWILIHLKAVGFVDSLKRRRGFSCSAAPHVVQYRKYLNPRDFKY